MATLISGLFPDREEAERAIDALEDLGYAQNDISVVMTGSTRERDFRGDAERTGAEDVHVAANVGVGASFGGTLGAIIAGVTATGAIVATGGMAAPIVAGPIAAILAGAGAGGLAGGIIGALTAAGVPESRANEYESELERGGILVGVNARPGDEPVARRILNDRDYAGAENLAELRDRGGDPGRDVRRADYATRDAGRADYLDGLDRTEYRTGELPRGGDVPTRQV
jgi:hypothetical protein